MDCPLISAIGVILKETCTELAPVASKWFLIGIQVGMNVAELQKLRQQYADPAELLREVLTFWLEGNTHIVPLLENAVKVLRTPSIDEEEFSDHLRVKYGLLEEGEPKPRSGTK